MDPAVANEHSSISLAEPSQLSVPPSAPSPSNPSRQKKHPINVRFQALALAEFGIPIADIKTHLKMSVNNIHRLRKTARIRGFDPAVSPVLKFEYVEDAPRSGRPNKVTPEMEEIVVSSFLGQKIEGNQKTRTIQVADEIGVSTTTVLRVLAARGIAFERSKENPDEGTWKQVPKKTPRERRKKIQNPEETLTSNPDDGLEGLPDFEMM